MIRTTQRSARMPFEVLVPGREPLPVRTAEIGATLARKFAKLYGESLVRPRERKPFRRRPTLAVVK